MPAGGAASPSVLHYASQTTREIAHRRVRRHRDGVQEMLKSERMGHKVPGMAGVYGHVMPEWRDRLRAQLQELWETSLHERARLSPHSAVGLVDKLLAPTGAPRTQSGPTLAPPTASRRARLKSRGN